MNVYYNSIYIIIELEFFGPVACLAILLRSDD